MITNTDVDSANPTIAIVLAFSFLVFLLIIIEPMDVIVSSSLMVTFEMRLISIWTIMIERILVIYQRNQMSMNLKYDVLGRSSLTEDKSETSTSNAVTAPMNLSVKFSMSIKRVE